MSLHKKCFVLPSFILFSAAILLSTNVLAQTCTQSDEVDASRRTSIEAALNHYFQMARQGDAAGLQANTTPDFTQIAGTIADNKDAFSGSPTLGSLYVLNNPAPSSPPQNDGRVEFFCGIFNSPDRVGFVFPALPAGTYAIAIQNTRSDKGSFRISWILALTDNQWKIAGLIPKDTTVGSHDGDWFAQQARLFKSKGQVHNAWLYYVMADELLRAFPAMSTPSLDKLYDEFQSSRPADLPYGSSLDLMASGKTFKVTSMFPAAVGKDIDLVIKYQTPDLSDTSRLFQDNSAVIKAVVTKYPEFRDAFAGVVARAVAPSGADYGTLLAMKDVK